MGTRHLCAVVSGGVFKVAQYGQWDGYPEGQGATVLDFLAGLGGDLSRFREAVNKCTWISDEEVEAAVNPHGNNWPKVFPHWSRDMGAKIFAHVLESGGCQLVDSSDFGGDSLSCEYAYVIDLDAETLEFYEGFQKAPHTGGRWADVPLVKPYPNCANDYCGCRLVKVFPLAELPTVADLVALVEKDEDTE